MMRLSKKADYGLVALKALVQLAPNESLSARELALRYNLPADLTPKVLARLAQAGLVEATMGKAGGYRLARRPADITVAEVVRILDGDNSMIPCNEGESLCHRFGECEIRDPLAGLNQEVMRVLDRMTIAQL
jgi:Rrf2 family protein